MIILCTVDITTREVTIPSDQRIASYDHKVDVIRFQVETIPGFSLDTSSIKIAAQGPNKARHDYAVDPSTVSIEEETGYITFDWPIPAGVTEMPIGSGFKYGDRGQLIFAVCAEIIDGSTVSKAWHSDDGIITVVAHLEPEAGGGEDPEEEATNRQMIGQLQTDVAVIRTEVGALANGSPTPVATVAEMTDESAVYLYTGSETGYTAGDWYYYDGSDWTQGGQYGGAVTDSTLTQEDVPADSKAVGDALALKADDADVTALDTRMTTAENTLSSITDAERTYNWNQYTGTGGEYSSGLNLLNGYIRPVTGSYPGRITSESSHYLYWFKAVSDVYVAIDTTSRVRLRISEEEPQTGNSKAFTGTVYGDSGDANMPTTEEPLLVESGKYIAFGNVSGGDAITLKYATSWTEGAGGLKQTILLTDAMETQVDTKINNVANGLEVIPMVWETGVFSTTVGADIRGTVSGSDTRKSAGIIHYPHPVYIENDRVFKVRISYAGSNFAIVSTSDFAAGKFITIPANTPVRMTISNQGSTTITEDDATINAHIKVYVLYGHDNTDVRWCAMGDSITEGWYSIIDNNEIHNYSDASKTWVGKVAKRNGWQVTNIGKGSTGWLDTVSESDITTAGFYVAQNTDFTPYNLVTLAYGINDWKANRTVGSYEDEPTSGTPTTVMQAMRATIEAIMASNPTCKIIVILPLNCNGYNHSYGTKATNYALGYAFSTSGTLQSYVEKMIEVCNYYGVQYIDQTHYSVINRENLPTMLPDGVHPSLDTHELLAHELSKKITF